MKAGRHTHNVQLGKTIRNLRESRGWNQEEFAFRCGTTTANLSRIETGKHGPSQDLLQVIAKSLGMQVSQLFALAEGLQTAVFPMQYSGDEIKLLAYYRKMSPARRLLLRQTAAVYANSAPSARKSRKIKP